MAQLVRYLAWKCEVWVWRSILKLGMVTCACNPIDDEISERPRQIPGTAWPASVACVAKMRANVRAHVKQGSWYLRSDSWDCLHTRQTHECLLTLPHRRNGFTQHFLVYRKFEPYPFALDGFLMHCKFGCALISTHSMPVAPGNECENKRSLQKPKGQSSERLENPCATLF